MRHAWLLLLFVTACSGVTVETGPRPTTPAGPTLTDVEWLLGDWVTDVDEHGCVISERWHRESEMLFVGRGKARCPAGSGEAHEPFHEDLRLEADERGLVYAATPRGAGRTDFDLTSGGATSFVAENPDHDFPTRIEYRRTETGFDAIVSGPGRSFTLSMHAAPPETPDSP